MAAFIASCCGMRLWNRYQREEDVLDRHPSRGPQAGEYGVLEREDRPQHDGDDEQRPPAE
jgi:hypothetical protein